MFVGLKEQGIRLNRHEKDHITYIFHQVLLHSIHKATKHGSLAIKRNCPHTIAALFSAAATSEWLLLLLQAAELSPGPVPHLGLEGGQGRRAALALAAGGERHEGGVVPAPDRALISQHQGDIIIYKDCTERLQPACG